MEMSVELFLANIVVILLSAKLFAEAAERLGQPAVLGELLGGVALGLGLIGFFRPEAPLLHVLSELGVILLMFQTGIHCDLDQLLKAGPASLAVALAGIVLPFGLGWGVMAALGHGGLQAVFVGAALTATSVGITARALKDLGRLQAPESQIIMGAALIDDVIGVILLSVLTSVAGTGEFSAAHAAKTTLLSALFLVVALAAGPRLTKMLVGLVDRMRARGVLIVAASCFAFGLALLAHAAGTALIVGAFTAGILLAGTDKKSDVDETISPVSDLFVPVFFVMVGARVDLKVYNPLHPENLPLLALTASLVVLAILGKLAAGWAARRPGLNRLAIGVGMVPRGEVGLIFAGIGLGAGILDASLYAAIVGMVVATTFAAPPLLKRAFRA